MVESVAFTGRVHTDRAETQFGASFAGAEPGVLDQINCGLVWADSWVQGLGQAEEAITSPSAEKEWCAAYSGRKVALECVIEEVQQSKWQSF